jgi:hypothetical protein
MEVRAYFPKPSKMSSLFLDRFPHEDLEQRHVQNKRALLTARLDDPRKALRY